MQEFITKEFFALLMEGVLGKKRMLGLLLNMFVVLA
jgi:hypothetical protein